MDIALYSFSDDENMEHALNESFDMSNRPTSTSTFRLNVSPIVTPKDKDKTSSESEKIFCSACMDYYSEHEMHMFKTCSHGLCKLYCADKLLTPHCPECGVSLYDETEK